MSDKADIALLAQLAPVHDAELVGAADSEEARASLAAILAAPVSSAPRTRSSKGRRRLPQRRRWLAAPVFAVAVAAAVLAVLVSNGSHGASTAAAATLRQVALVAKRQQPLTPGPGQYVYTKSVDVEASIGKLTKDQPPTTMMIPHVREIWLGPDGGRLHETGGKLQPLSAADRARWIAAGKPTWGGGTSDMKLAPTPPLNLPTDPDALYAQLKQQAQGHGDGLYTEMFTLVGDSLRETSATPAQRAALYEVAARIPGVQLLGSTTDSVGRPGIAVAMDDPGQGIRETLIFDPNTSALLAEEQVLLPGNPYGEPAGARIGSATYLVQKIVNSDTATP